MNSEHIKELACPACRGELIGPGGPGPVEEGSLECTACSVRYPITGGIPRMVESTPSRSDSTRVDPRTRAAFGFEWLRYPVTTYEEDIVTLVGLTGVEPALYERVGFRNLFSHVPAPDDVAAATTTYFEGKKVLEAGCGMGKYVKVVAGQRPRLVVGLDASDAVERAQEVTRGLHNVLIVQGDIFRPPLRTGFDFAYSVGVLHHTPDPRRAFLQVAGLVRPGGELSVWLYPHARRPLPLLIEFWHERLLRPLTSRLPHRSLERLCAGLGRLTAYKTRLLGKGGRVRTALARVINLVAVGEHRDPALAAFLNFDWYSPPYRSRHVAEEVHEWYRSAGFAEPRFLPVALSAIARNEGTAPPL